MDTPLTTLRKAGMVVRRQQRDDEARWQGARSWLGGLPHIRLEDWPRHQKTRTPLYHLAQLDLADLPSGPWSPLLPARGALCFFYDVETIEHHDSPTVVYVPDPDTCRPCPPPSDSLPFGGKNHWHREHLNRHLTRIEDAQRVMPRWPVDFVPVSCTELWPEDQDREVVFEPTLDDILGPPPGYVRTPAPKNGPNLAPVCLTNEAPWEAARRVVIALQNNARFDPARDVPPGIVAQIKERAVGARRREAALNGFLARWVPQIEAHDPYALIPEDVALAFIEDIWALRWNRTISPKSWHDVTDLCVAGRDIYRDMLLGPREMFEKVPPQVRARIDNEWRHTSTDGPHQMFGLGRDLQGYLEEWDAHVLLFQATFDHMMDWEFGDLGVIQFFITPKDLAEGNWGAVRGYYTCG